MIRKFKDFNIEEIKKNDQEFFERELNSRKKSKEDISLKYDYQLNEIEDFIKKEIEDNEDYTVNIGKRIGFFAGKEIENIHIEYKSTNIGEVKIYKPEDNSDEGYFEVNGNIYVTSANDIRNFYHYLTLQLKNNTLTESVQDNPFKYNMTKATFDDWVGLYVDGILIEQGHSIYWYRILEILINMKIDLGKYEIKSFPKELTEEDGDILGYHLPNTLQELYEKLNIKY